MEYLRHKRALLQLWGGYTLIEILVVFAIIAILSTLTWGVFARVQENGRNSVCQNNLGQIGQAVQQYVQDHDARFPKGFDLQQELHTYTKTPQIFKCPSDPLPEEAGTPRIDVASSSYAQSLVTLQFVNHQPGGRPESTIPNTAQTVLVYENVFRTGLALSPIETPTSCGVTDMEVATMHFNGANHLFMDGHVKWLSTAQFLQTWCDDF